MTLYEFIKQLLYPNIDIWESHTITIIFTTSLATILAYFVLGDRERLIKKLEHANDNLEEQVEKRTEELGKTCQSLKQSEEKYRELVENANSAIIKLDKDGNILFFNEFAEKFFGFSDEEIKGKNVIGTIIPLNESFRKGLQNLMTKIINDPENNIRIENKNITKNGDEVWVSWSNKCIYNEKRELEGILSIGTDITETKLARIKLENLIKELKRSNDELRQFTYITSHDLQEPLRNIASYAQLIERRYKGKLDSDADDFIKYMVDGAFRMKQQIQSLLDYSRVGTQKTKFKEFESENALNYALNNLKDAINENDAKITYDFLPVIFADQEQIIRVFQNLIGNALKFCKYGVKPEIHVSARKKDNEHIFSVNDNGIGLEEKYSDQIFEVFKRLHAIGEYEGAGIGLAIVKRIIDRHNGRIWVESELDKGSTFYFTLPLTKLKHDSQLK